MSRTPHWPALEGFPLMGLELVEHSARMKRREMRQLRNESKMSRQAILQVRKQRKENRKAMRRLRISRSSDATPTNTNPLNTVSSLAVLNDTSGSDAALHDDPGAMASSFQDDFDCSAIEAGECSVCMEDSPFNKGIQTCSKHFTCYSCLWASFLHALNDASQFPTSCCPVKKLGVDDSGNRVYAPPISYELVRPLLGDHLTRKYQSRLWEYDTPVALRVYCSNPDCRKFVPPRFFKTYRIEIANLDGGTEWVDSVYTAAPCACGTDTCLGCKTTLSPNHRCSNWGDEQPLPAEYSSDFRIKRCPNCRTVIHLVDACNHMLCSCRHQFCFVCLRNWRAHTDCPSYGDPAVGYDEEGYERSARGIHCLTGRDRNGFDADGRDRNGFDADGRNVDDTARVIREGGNMLNAIAELVDDAMFFDIEEGEIVEPQRGRRRMSDVSTEDWAFDPDAVAPNPMRRAEITFHELQERAARLRMFDRVAGRLAAGLDFLDDEDGHVSSSAALTHFRRPEPPLPTIIQLECTHFFRFAHGVGCCQVCRWFMPMFCFNCTLCGLKVCRVCRYYLNARMEQYFYRGETSMVGPIQWAEAGVVPFKRERVMRRHAEPDYAAMICMFDRAERNLLVEQPWYYDFWEADKEWEISRVEGTEFLVFYIRTCVAVPFVWLMTDPNYYSVLGDSMDLGGSVNGGVESPDDEDSVDSEVLEYAEDLEDSVDMRARRILEPWWT